ncbi:isomerase [Streptomyces sp. SID13666]|uniref:5-carboxymethyl-2-hydroxymuconate Delta-isomerase n=1 Tax=Streptomyces TaxID=1883 RepID=UPI0011059403|nr:MULTISPECIES: isomerase [Streptomyces]MCZ4097723.1 isomerase [Streptomyces sp. H39-C1]NEA59577.1 isomerase [Streptomyces sp. SID13666]NEA72698.1 isomerase [Streptomyces sp. SID13588]QNA73016.1 isomerase [Streptomyces sp. So13.3]
MPHIAVDYSATLTDTFDRQGFAQALHPLVAKIADAQVSGCKTRFRPLDEIVISDGGTAEAMIHIQVALLDGRTPETKLELSTAVLALAREHTAATPGLTVHSSVEIRDLDRASYQRHSS